MAYLTAFAVLLLCVFAIFLGQMAVQIIKIEKKIAGLQEILEEEIIDVFGTAAAKKELPAGPSPAQAPKAPTKS